MVRFLKLTTPLEVDGADLVLRLLKKDYRPACWRCFQLHYRVRKHFPPVPGNSANTNPRPSLQSYPSSKFKGLSVAGLYIIRRQRKTAGILPPVYQAWHAAILFSCAINVIILVMPCVQSSLSRVDSSDAIN